MMRSSFLANPIARALFFILAVTAGRVSLLAFNGTDLFVDEAQYWLWGQDLAFGYYSKPPLIGWVIRAATSLAGSDSAFWVRVSAPLFHALTACLIIAVTRQVHTPAAAAMAGAAYITLPAVSLGSQVISTDTIMLPFFTLALLAYLHLARRPDARWAIVMGLAVGLGLMSKYAMIYFVGCAALTATLYPEMRIARRDLLIASLAAFAIVSPNVLWNLTNEFSTLQATADNATGAGWRFNPAGAAEFIGAQFAVFGPIFFAAYLWLCLRAIRRRLPRQSGILVAMSLPILLVVVGESLISRAYANWAVATYIGATILTVPWLWDHARAWLTISLGLQLAVAIALPVSATVPYAFGMGDRLAYGRILGRAEMSQNIMTTAREAGVRVVVAHDRGVLADLMYRAKGTDLAVYAFPPRGRAANHYELKFPLPAGIKENVLFITRDPHPPPCREGVPYREIARWSPARGAYRGRTYTAYEVRPECWRNQR